MDIKRVDVLGQRYRVRQKNLLKDGLYGLCDREKYIIDIDNSITNEHKYRTLFHEVGHAVMARNGLCFSGLIAPEVEEIIVETIGNGHYEMMRKFIKEMLKDEDHILRNKLRAFIG